MVNPIERMIIILQEKGEFDLNDFDVYFMIHSLGIKRGGMTRAAIQRAHMLSGQIDRVGLITFDFNPDYESVIQEFQRLGQWHEAMKHFNVYEFLMERHDKQSEETPVREFMKMPGVQMEKVHIYKDGRLHKTEYVAGKKKPVKTELYDTNGSIRQELYYCTSTQKKVAEQLNDVQGRPFLRKTFQPESGKMTACQWLDNKGNSIRSFSSIKSYRHFFLDSLLREKESILLSDGRFTDKMLFGIRNTNVAKIAVLHSNHLQSPFEYGSSIVKRNEPLLRQIGSLDAFVTLTERQAEDIKSRFGRRPTVHAVGHPAEDIAGHDTIREPYTAVIVARYEGIKQICHAIKAFSRVVKEVPEATLEIWGFGKEEAAYRKLIRKHRLQSHVLIKGFTSDVKEVYNRSAFSVMTSKSEAFGMSVIESMSAGTPVICYACDYGPSDIVIDGKNGILVRPGDVRGLAEAMIDLFKDVEKQKRLGNEARKITHLYGKEKVRLKWMEIFMEARKQSGRRIDIQDIQAEILRVSLDEEKGLYLAGEMSFTVSAPESAAPERNITLFLQLRKQGWRQDVYTPLRITEFKSGAINFDGAFADFHDLEKGSWDLYLSVGCLNFHEFIRPSVKSDVEKSDIQNGQIAILRVSENSGRPFLRIRSHLRKNKFNARLTLQRCKAKIRDTVRRG